MDERVLLTDDEVAAAMKRHAIEEVIALCRSRVAHPGGDVSLELRHAIGILFLLERDRALIGELTAALEEWLEVVPKPQSWCHDTWSLTRTLLARVQEASAGRTE